MGLTSNAGVLLNGCLGEIRAVDLPSGRVCISLGPLDPPESWKRIKPDNVKLVSDVVVHPGLEDYGNGEDFQFYDELGEDDWGSDGADEEGDEWR